MILLSEKYIYNIRNNSLFAEQIRNELFVSVLLNNICLPGTFLLGEEGNSPDLINNNKDIGYEITQCDLDCDLDSKYISIALNETNYDYNTFSQKIAEYGVDVNKYHFNISEDGKVLSFGPDGKGNASYYFLEIFKKNFIKKFKKLNKGNYSNCKETSLIVTSVSRHKDDTDAIVIFKQYIKCCEEFEINFKKLYLITSSKIYIFANNEVKSFSVDEKWSSCIVETNKILKSVKNKTTLYSEFPTLCFEWGPNEKTPLDYGCKSGESVNWKCEKGHVYDAVINKRTTRGNGCPYCSGHRVLAGFNDLQTTHPQISIQWHPTLNENKKPCDYSKGSMEEVWWLCPNGHSFKKNINAKKESNDCPYCSHREVIVGETDLATTNPCLAKEWHPTLNGPLKASDVFEKSDKKVWWLCPQGHSYKASIHHRSSDKTGCPLCAKEKKVSFPEKLIFYYLSKGLTNVFENYNPGLPNGGNLDIFLDNFKIGIEYDGEHWHKKITNDIKKNENCKKLGIKLIRIREEGCPKLNSSSYDIYVKSGDYESMLCELKKALADLANINFEYELNIEEDSPIIDALIFSKTKENCISNNEALMKEWDFEKNKGINPTYISAGSDKKYWWVCYHGHSWKASALNRSRGQGCPYCCNRSLLKGFNDLLTTNPELEKEWDYDKNIEKPDEVMKGSAKRVWWKCDHGHSYKIELREKKEKYCPVCEMNIIQTGVNDVFTLFPELKEEWDFEKNANINPEKLSPGSNKKVAWKCKKCGNVWFQKIYRRTKDKAKCPMCKNFQTSTLRKNKELKKYFEKLAKNTLKAFVNRDFSNLKVIDKPDLQSLKIGYGIEVRECKNTYEGTADLFTRDYFSSKNPDILMEEKLKDLKINGWFHRDDKTNSVAFSPYAGTFDLKQKKIFVAECIKEKSLRSKGYKKFKNNCLYLFCRWSYSKEDILEIIDNITVNKFDIIFFDCMDKLYSYKDKLIKEYAFKKDLYATILENLRKEFFIKDKRKNNGSK